MNVYAALVRQEASMYDLEKGGPDIIHTIQMGNSRKYPYPTTDGFHVLTPPCLRKFQNALPPPPPPPLMPSEFHNREPPLPFRISGFSGKYIFDFSNAYMNKRT